MGSRKFRCLWGEHLISLGALRAAGTPPQNLAVLHLDAHADLRTEYLGEADSHAAVMYHVHHELGLEIFQFGIRSAAAEEVAYAERHTHFYPFQVWSRCVRCCRGCRDSPFICRWI